MIPLASRSKVTSICGTPRGAGGGSHGGDDGPTVEEVD